MYMLIDIHTIPFVKKIMYNFNWYTGFRMEFDENWQNKSQ